MSIKVARNKRRRDAGAVERIDQKDIRSPVTTLNKVSAVLEEDLEAIIVRWNVKPFSICRSRPQRERSEARGEILH